MKYAAAIFFASTAAAATLAVPTLADLQKLGLPQCGIPCTAVTQGCDPKKLKNATDLYKCRCKNETYKKAVTACIPAKCKSPADQAKFVKLQGLCKSMPAHAHLRAILDILQEPVSAPELLKRQGEDESPLSFPPAGASIEARSPQDMDDGADDVEAAVMPEEFTQLNKRQYPYGNGAYYQGDTQSVQINRLPGATPVVDDTSVYLNGGPGYSGYGGFGSFGGYGAGLGGYGGGYGGGFGSYGGYGFH